MRQRARAYPPDSAVFAKIQVGLNGSRGSDYLPEEYDHREQLLAWARNCLLQQEYLELVSDEEDLFIALQRGTRVSVRNTAVLVGKNPGALSRKQESLYRKLHSGIVAKVICALLKERTFALVELQKTGRIRSDADRYAVPINGRGISFDHIPSSEQVSSWIHKNWEPLLLPKGSTNQDPVPHIQCKRDQVTGGVTLDVVWVTLDGLQAREVAKLNLQGSVAHLPASDRIGL
jgi:hypothetical protein